MAKTMTLTVVDVSRSEGPLYQAHGEDEMLVVFDCGVTALASDGKVYRHVSFVVRGALDSGEGFKVPNRRYRDEVEAFASKVRARGVIDLRYWVEVPAEPSWEEREAYNLRCEAEERADWC